MWSTSSSVRSPFLVRSSSTIRLPDRWPVDSPPSDCPTDVDSSVSSHCSSSDGDMFTDCCQSGQTSESSRLIAVLVLLLLERRRLVDGLAAALVALDQVLR